MTDTAGRFFISYAGVDRLWAEWVGWHLEQSGHRVILDVWDWRTGDDFVQRMDEGLEQADAVVALLSKAYFEEGRWTGDESSAAVARRDRIIPLAVEPLTNTDIRPMLASRLRKDLHGLDEPTALAALLEAVNGGERPAAPPSYPGDGAPLGVAVPGALKPRLPGSTGRPEMWHVRRPNPDFSGREAQLVQLRDGLLSGRHSVVNALHGMGGIGKTQIALEYAHRFAGQYDLVWWIDAERTDQIPVHYTELADRLGIAIPEAGAEHNARMLLQHLRKLPRWLVILDNAEDPEQIESWLPEGPGHVLITSRNPNWRGIAQPTALDVFTRADSLAYLRTRVRGIAEDQADALGKDLGDLPLALAQAVGVIGSGMSLDRYRRLLTEKAGRILQEGAAPGYPASLAASVGIATVRLGDEHPDAAALLRLAGFLGPEPIPTAWFENARPRLSTIPGDPDDLMWPKAALEPLNRYGLARIDGTAFQVHRLTQAVLRDHADPAQTKLIHDDAVAVLAAVTPGDPEAPANWSAWAILVSHLTARHIDVTGRPELRPTLRDAVDFLLRSGQPQSAADLVTALREAWTSRLGPDDPYVLTCTQYLGHATSDRGDPRAARPIIEDALSRRRRTLGDDHPETLHSANDLGAILARLGEYEEALRVGEDTLVRRRRVLGDDHRDTLRSADNMAAAFNHLGRYAEARILTGDTLARRRSVFGDDHPATLGSAHGLAVTLSNLGEYGEARRLYERNLSRCRRVLGDDHPATLGSVNGLADTLHRLGEYGEARRLHESTVAGCRRVFGVDHPETLRATEGLAVTLSKLGEYGEARRLLEDTLSRCRRVLGDDHPDTLSTVHGLATTLSDRGEYGEVGRLLEDNLSRCRRVLGDDHPDTLRSARALAATLYSLRAYPAGAQLLEETLARCRRVFGDDHPDTQKATHALAATYTAMGMKHKAQKLLAPKKPKRRLGRKRR